MLTVIPQWTKYSQSDNENEKHELIKDSDTEIIAPEEIELTDNPGNESVLTLEPNVHFVD